MCVTKCARVSVLLHSHWFGEELDKLRGNRKQWSSGTHHVVALPIVRGLRTSPDRATEQEEDKTKCVCAAM